MPTLTETLKQKVDELQLERHLNEAVEAGEKAMRQAVTKAGEFAHQNREKAETFLDKAAATIDEKTDGKYADKVKKVADQVKAGVSRLADQREAESDAAEAGSERAGSEAAGSEAAGSEAADPSTDEASTADPSTAGASTVSAESAISEEVETPADRKTKTEPTKFDWDAVTDET